MFSQGIISYSSSSLSSVITYINLLNKGGGLVGSIM